MSFQFYWYLWVIWIIVIFFYRNPLKGRVYSIWIMIAIILTGRIFIMDDVSITCTLVYLWGSSLFMLMRNSLSTKEWTYLLLFSMGMASVQLFIFINPVWYMLASDLFIILAGYLMLSILTADTLLRMKMWLFISSTGVFTSDYILYSYGLQSVIGSPDDLVWCVKGIVVFIILIALRTWKHQIKNSARLIRTKNHTA